MSSHERRLRMALGLSLVGMALLFYGCSSGGGGAVLPGPSGPGSVTASTQVLVRPFMLVEEALRAEIVARQAELEAMGLLVSPDGVMVAFPASPAAHWTARLGDQVVRLDAEGRFSVTLLPGGPAKGTLTHPSDERLFTEFAVEALTPGSSLVIPMPFAGPCGMSAVEDADCNGQDPPPEMLPPEFGVVRASSEPCCEKVPNRAEPTDVSVGPRGTYPNVEKVSDFRCEDKNGTLAGLTSNKYVAYLGSTCDLYVQTGACPNENAFSDIEYNAILAALPQKNFAEGLLHGEFQQYLSGPLNPTSELDCPHNHKGRSCQHVKIGDLSVDIRGAITFPNDETAVELCPGESVEFVVHNNGNYGITFVDKLREEIPGALSGEGLVTKNGGLQVRHFDPTSFEPVPSAPYPKYQADRTLVFTTPAQAVPGSRDTYRFTVDGRTVTVHFVIKPCASPSPSPSESPVPDTIQVTPTTMAGNHKVGVSPCPQLVDSFSVGNATDGPITVTVTPGPHLFTDGPQQFQLQPGGAAQQDVFFDCSRQTSFTSTVTVTAGATTKTITVNMTVGP